MNDDTIMNDETIRNEEDLMDIDSEGDLGTGEVGDRNVLGGFFGSVDVGVIREPFSNTSSASSVSKFNAYVMTDPTRPNVLRTPRGKRERVVSVRRIKPFHELPSRLHAYPDEVLEEAPEQPRPHEIPCPSISRNDDDTPFDQVSNSVWQPCSNFTSIRKRDVLRLLFHGRSITYDQYRIYFARVDYINPRRSGLRVKWLPASVDKSVVNQLQYISVTALFKYYDVWLGVPFRQTWRGT